MSCAEPRQQEIGGGYALSGSGFRRQTHRERHQTLSGKGQGTGEVEQEVEVKKDHPQQGGSLPLCNIEPSSTC